MNRSVVIAGSTILIVLIDQLTKWWASWVIYISIIPNMVAIKYAENTGIAFSLPLEGIALQVITVLFIGILVYLFFKEKAYQSHLLLAAYTLIIGGALGNAIDRFFRGYVIDMFSIGSFPIFNVADSCVTIGVVLLLLYELFKKREEEEVMVITRKK